MHLFIFMILFWSEIKSTRGTIRRTKSESVRDYACRKFNATKTDEFDHLRLLIDFLLIKFENMMCNFEKNQALEIKIKQFRHSEFWKMRADGVTKMLLDNSENEQKLLENRKKIVNFQIEVFLILRTFFNDLMKFDKREIEPKKSSELEKLIKSMSSAFSLVVRYYCEVIYRNTVQSGDSSSTNNIIHHESLFERLQEFRSFKSNCESHLQKIELDTLLQEIYVDIIVLTGAFKDQIQNQQSFIELFLNH